jgi:hypothetical protein
MAVLQSMRGFQSLSIGFFASQNVSGEQPDVGAWAAREAVAAGMKKPGKGCWLERDTPSENSSDGTDLPADTKGGALETI